jgi:sugar-specific transcriptional regulator TrmB
MTKKELQKKIAQYESQIDQLETELAYLEELTRLVGFNDGLNSLKRAAQDILWDLEKERQI